MSEEAQGGNTVSAGNRHLDWDRVLDRVRLHLADVQGDRGLVVPGRAGIDQAICKTKGMLVMLDLASWEDHVEDLLRPQLESLLGVLEMAQREYIQKGETQ